MSLSSTIDPKLLPNLPGFRARPQKTGFKKHCFDVVGGQVFLRPDALGSTNSSEGEEGSIASIGNTVVKSARRHLNQNGSNAILNYAAFFEESVDGSSKPQIRKCNIYFYTEDGSIKVVEKPQVNSGVTQGTLVRRAVVKRPDGTPTTEFDLHVGNIVNIYGRQFKIYDCDNSTRQYVRDNFGYEEDNAMDVPNDPYSNYRRTLEAGLDDTWGKFHSKKNDNKIFTEARLGNSVDNSGREGFIKFGQTQLKFRCVWDDTQHLYGDVIEFTLQYYLADDTLEINSIPSQFTKETNRIKLLKRSKLPRDFHTTMGLGVRAPTDQFFKWNDFYIGMQLEVYGRLLRIIDADSNTRAFYEAQGMPLDEAIVRPPPEVVVHSREIPPPTGFGSEEDSLRSVAGSLMAGPAPVKKMGENRILSFLASLLSGGIDDVDRRFVLTYYVQDNTLNVIEPPVRNSGFTGGTFLSRRVVKKQNGETITEKDLYLGCRLRVLMHEFLLLETSDATLRWMEDKGLPRSNIFKVLDKIRPRLIEDAANGNLSRLFQSYETPEGGNGQASKAALEAVLRAYGLFNNDNPQLVSEHEMITILRAAGNKLPTFNYEKFIEQIINPTDEYK